MAFFYPGEEHWPHLMGRGRCQEGGWARPQPPRQRRSPFTKVGEGVYPLLKN